MFRTPSHTELLRSSGAEDSVPRNIILRGAEDDVPRKKIFRVTEDDVPRADFHPPCGCSVGVPGGRDAKDTATLKIYVSIRLVSGKRRFATTSKGSVRLTEKYKNNKKKFDKISFS